MMIICRLVLEHLKKSFLTFFIFYCLLPKA
jgi:hypothetical protein